MHWRCCSWQKGTCQNEAMLISEEIKPTAFAVIVLHVHLSEGIMLSDSQSVSRKIC